MTDKPSISAYRQLANTGLLEAAWQGLNKKNPQSCGVDGEKIVHFSAQLHPKLSALAQSLRRGDFAFQRVKGVTIPKDDSRPDAGSRPLRIPTVKDRIVLKALQLFLEPRLARFNAPFSYAYKTKGSADPRFRGGTFRAIAHARELAHRYEYVLEADIRSYFENVDRDRLASTLFKVQHLSSLTPLLEAALQLETEVGPSVSAEDHALFENDERGIPQGSALSPLLANLYLAYFDLCMTEAGWELLRYADDIVVFAKSADEARRAYDEARATLHAMGLNMHELSSGATAKTKVRKVKSDGVDFVGYRVQGNKIFPSSKTLEKFRREIELTTMVTNVGKVGFRHAAAKGRDSVISRAASVINKVEGKAASLACCDECQEILDLGLVVQKRFLGMFEYIGLIPPDHAPARLRLLGVPDLEGTWRDHQKRFHARATPPSPQLSDASDWARRNRVILKAAFNAAGSKAGA